MVGDILGHDTVGANGHVIPNLDRAHDLGAGADVDVVAEHRAALLFAAIRLAQRHTVRDVAIPADDAFLVHHNAAEVPDVEPAANGGFERNRDPELVRVVAEHAAREGICLLYTSDAADE